jgi:transcriptional antiterminator RfaH
MSYWACARTETGREKFAEHMLARAGFATYFPIIAVRRGLNGRRTTVTSPLFANYLFFTVGADGHWYDAKRTPGVNSVLLDGQRPARVPDQVILGLKARERDGFISLPRFRVGDAVRITKGAFAGVDALYSGQAPRERARILLEWLGQPRLTIIPESDIERA